jgi:hypothetical protein
MCHRLHAACCTASRCTTQPWLTAEPMQHRCWHREPHVCIHHQALRATAWPQVSLQRAQAAGF